MSDVQRKSTEYTLLNTADPTLWAEEFCRIFSGKMVMADEFNDEYHGPVTPVLMTSWFATAMETALRLFNRGVDEAEHLSVEELADEEALAFDESTEALAEALDRDERDERTRNEDQFVVGFYEGRPEEL